jgi:porin
MKNRNDSILLPLVAMISGVINAVAAGPVALGQVRTDFETNRPFDTRPFEIVLPSDHVLGNWFGLRTEMENAGIDPSLTLLTEFAANPVGGKSQGATQATNIGLSFHFDLDRIAGIKGGSFLLSFSERFGNSLSAEYIGNFFPTQEVYGGETFHVVDIAYLQKLFDDHVEFRLGRIATADDFLVSPYDYLFMQNAIDGFPHGIFYNAPGMTVYPKATWGALVRVKPTPRCYAMVGVYNGDPSIRANDRHGVDFSLNGPVFAIGEIGYQINGLPGDTGLLGNYKAGVWYDGSELPDFQTNESVRGSTGFYALFDQVIAPFGAPGSNRGLAIFGSVTFGVDPAVQQMPFFCTAGIAERGLWASRPADWCGLGVMYGHFSNDLQDSQREEQAMDPTVGVQDYEIAMELFYRLYFHRHSVFVQPDLQYIVRPGGTGQIDNALVLGFQVGVNF